MLTILGLFGKASAKIIATFVMVIVLMLLGFMFFPGLLNQLSDLANYLEGHVRNPGLDEQGTFLFRTLINENTIFGMLATIIARAVVEFFAWIFGSIWTSMRGPKNVSNAEGYY
jgi:hypothetical protein